MIALPANEDGSERRLRKAEVVNSVTSGRERRGWNAVHQQIACVDAADRLRKCDGYVREIQQVTLGRVRRQQAGSNAAEVNWISIELSVEAEIAAEISFIEP